MLRFCILGNYVQSVPLSKNRKKSASKIAKGTNVPIKSSVKKSTTKKKALQTATATTTEDDIVFASGASSVDVNESMQPLLEQDQPWNYEDTAVQDIPSFEISSIESGKRLRLEGKSRIMDTSLN